MHKGYLLGKELFKGFKGDKLGGGGSEFALETHSKRKIEYSKIYT
jgi:hypothetical protein